MIAVHGKRSMLGALFDEVERVVLLRVTTLIALDNLYRRSSNYPAAMMITIEVVEVLVRPSRAIRARTSRADSQTYINSACWHTFSPLDIPWNMQQPRDWSKSLLAAPTRTDIQCFKINR